MKNIFSIIFSTLILFSCSESINKEKVKVFVSWQGGEGLPHYIWHKTKDKPEGIEPKLIERILEIAKLDYEYIKDYDAENVGDPRIESIVKGKADISIRAITINEERKQKVLFSTLYYTDGLSALVRVRSGINSLEDLNGKNVYALKFTTAYDWVKQNIPKCNLMTYEKFDTAFVEPQSLLLTGKIDAYVIDYTFLKYIQKSNPTLRVLETKFTEEKIGIAVSKSKPELLKKINKAISILEKSGEMKKLIVDFE